MQNDIIQNQNYDKIMIARYKDSVKYDEHTSYSLSIKNDNDLTSLGFANELNLRSLDIMGCKNVNFSQACDLRTLKIEGCGLTSIEGIQKFQSVENLHLSDNFISDLEPLRPLTDLRSLNLKNNKASNIEPLQDLTNIIFLQLENNGITDISPLRFMRQLAITWLMSNKISDLEPFKDLYSLERVVLTNNQIENLEPLRELNLIFLNVEHNYIRDLSPVKNHQNFARFMVKSQKVKE
ncbi:T9SS_type A sorting domain-containing protein [Hexamita inflata]|uniref:T9SS type A sorting domain-containing protein n=1 Tax=Hexamita inflata TaxID=28002 RepID=A0AA86Q150_9EUKA|nr:T9SS type A sorting domain-containing protein [Hexamita inflata]CAI9956068.1 T9SS type A sorting domain-containing protein [Hexamita inflata]